MVTSELSQIKLFTELLCLEIFLFNLLEQRLTLELIAQPHQVGYGATRRLLQFSSSVNFNDSFRSKNFNDNSIGLTIRLLVRIFSVFVFNKLTVSRIKKWE
jgi:hypothetical protein